VESILMQDYPNLEVVVSDNASTDNTGAAIERFRSDSRFKYFRNEKNLGMIGNFHRALYDYSTGDYALHLDGDDYLTDSHYISDAMELIEREGLVMVFSRYRSLYEKDQSFIEDKVNSDLPEIIDGNWLLLNYYKGYSLTTLTVVHDRRHAMDVGFFEKDIRSTDWEGLLKLIINRKVGFINRFVGVWRRHGLNETMKQDIKRYLDNVEYIESPYRFAMEKQYFSKPVLDQWRRRMLKRYFVQILVRALLIENKEQERAILDFLKTYDVNVYRSLRRDIRFHGLKLIMKNRLLVLFVFKYILKQESFFRDFEYIHAGIRK
jgi:glycosyltransferase involved in cell wall biosynthesis